jgi:DNA repair exonuclease SbcCD ATPase subunit
MQAVLKDVLQDKAARQADLDSLRVLRQEVQELKSEVRLASEHSSDKDSNAGVLEEWVKGSVVELRGEVREVERRLEEEQELDQRLHQLQDREAGTEKRLDKLQSLVVTAKVVNFFIFCEIRNSKTSSHLKRNLNKIFTVLYE